MYERVLSNVFPTMFGFSDGKDAVRQQSSATISPFADLALIVSPAPSKHANRRMRFGFARSMLLCGLRVCAAVTHCVKRRRTIRLVSRQGTGRIRPTTRP